MLMHTAFEIGPDDIENVLRSNALLVANSDGKDFGTMAAEIVSAMSDADLSRIEFAALASGVDMEDQVAGAYAEIRAILVNDGVLKR